MRAKSFFGEGAYLVATMSYGAIRKVVQVKDATLTSFNYDDDARRYVKKQVPMLNVAKAGLVVAGALSSVCLGRSTLSPMRVTSRSG
jgi:hypothetical protein